QNETSRAVRPPLQYAERLSQKYWKGSAGCSTIRSEIHSKEPRSWRKHLSSCPADAIFSNTQPSPRLALRLDGCLLFRRSKRRRATPARSFPVSKPSSSRLQAAS